MLPPSPSFLAPNARCTPHHTQTCRFCSDGPPLRKDKQYIMTCHPHGAVTYNHVLFFTDSCSTLREGLLPDPQGVADGAARQTAPEGSPGSDAAADRASSGWFRRDLGARILFKIPIWRDVLLWLGLVDAGRPVAEAVLRRGGSLFIYPGGEREQIAVARGQHVALTKRHLGFIRLALRHGVGIVPGYAFGEVDLYHTSNFLINFRRWLVRTLAIALPIFFGRGLTIVPLAGCRVGVVFGRELEVPKASAPPSLEQVEDLAERYRKELQRIFEENKSRFGLDEGTQLELR